MARRIAACFIVCYLAVLGYGLSAHTVGYKTYAHVGMYYIVWDMYCGWTGWESRTQILAEGASGTYYDVGSPPWGETCVYGGPDRRHYDTYGLHAIKIAENVARHTEHEPFVRYIVVEEAWSKKYNLPDSLWAQRFEEPREPRIYRRIRAAYEGEGECIASNPSWTNWLMAQALGDNPRLQQDMKVHTPFMTADHFSRSPSVIVPVGGYGPAAGDGGSAK
jgi:hypothetical protein